MCSSHSLSHSSDELFSSGSVSFVITQVSGLRDKCSSYFCNGHTQGILIISQDKSLKIRIIWGIVACVVFGTGQERPTLPTLPFPCANLLCPHFQGSCKVSYNLLVNLDTTPILTLGSLWSTPKLQFSDWCHFTSECLYRLRNVLLIAGCSAGALTC